MSGGGEGDRPGLAAPRASGDRQPIRAERIDLFSLDIKFLAAVIIVVADDLPQVIMFEGEPFLRSPGHHHRPRYLQVRAFRADGLEVSQ